MREGESMTAVEKWVFFFQLLQGVRQAGSVIVAFYGVHLVQRYTRRRDQADFIAKPRSRKIFVILVNLVNGIFGWKHNVTMG